MMKRAWHPDELAEQWTILPEEQQWIGNKYGPTRLGFVVLLKFLSIHVMRDTLWYQPVSAMA